MQNENSQLIDHLFRHQFGKMVAILTRIFGLQHLETIEDAVQDTFIKAMSAWRNEIPENPEAWLTQAAKFRTIDLFRKLKAAGEREKFLNHGRASSALNEMFLDNEIADSQLRMIFTACHPSLDLRDQIAFALKAISGFSQKEIASALLSKEETIKKRLVRARKKIQESNISFEIPTGAELPQRLNRVLEVLYLIFNEGFHSNKKEKLVRQELCEEAMRLTAMLLENKTCNRPEVHALFALICFHSARLESKVSAEGEVIDLRKQDRQKWDVDLMKLGSLAMFEAINTQSLTRYHFEASIASEHIRSKSFEDTDWKRILMWYERLNQLEPSPFNLLNMAIVNIQIEAFEKADRLLKVVDAKSLEQRAYLYYGCLAELQKKSGKPGEAIESYQKAISLVNNEAEKVYLERKLKRLQSGD